MIVVTFARTHDAFAFEDAARAHGVPGRLIPLPTGIAATCGLAWRLPPDAPATALSPLSALARQAVYRQSQGDFERLDAHAPTLAWTPSDPTRRPLLDALDLPPTGALTAVGAGGKTSILHTLAAEGATANQAVLLTTTTKMAAAPDLITDPDAALAALTPGRVVFAGQLTGEKLGGFDAPTLDSLRRAADLTLIEGDGSRRLPIKVPAHYEPVVPIWTDHLLVVVGLSSIGRPLADVCCRVELASEILQTDAASHLVSPESAAALIQAGYLDNPGLAAWRGRTTVVLNQADDPSRAAAGRAIAERLGGVRVLLSTNQRDAS